MCVYMQSCIYIPISFVIVIKFCVNVCIYFVYYGSKYGTGSFSVVHFLRFWYLPYAVYLKVIVNFFQFNNELKCFC